MKKLTLFYAATAMLILAVSLAPAPAAAQTDTSQISDDQVNAIAKELYCPVCESTPLDVCPTQACADWREVIRTKLAEGQSEEEIRAYFAEQYGARALSEPPREGFTLAVWIAPILAVLVGAVFFSRYLSRIRDSAGPAAEAAAEPVKATPKPEPDDYQARIEQELRENRS
jgi:cytochrome c-type biogenesis protein CcmH